MTEILYDQKTGLKIGTVTLENGKFVPKVMGMNIPHKEFNYLTCCKGYIRACVYKGYHSRDNANQLKIAL